MSTHGASGPAFAAGMIHAARLTESGVVKRTRRSFSARLGDGTSNRRDPGWYTSDRSTSRTPIMAPTYAKHARMRTVFTSLTTYGCLLAGAECLLPTSTAPGRRRIALHRQQQRDPGREYR